MKGVSVVGEAVCESVDGTTEGESVDNRGNCVGKEGALVLPNIEGCALGAATGTIPEGAGKTDVGKTETGEAVGRTVAVAFVGFFVGRLIIGGEVTLGSAVGVTELSPTVGCSEGRFGASVGAVGELVMPGNE